MDGGWETPVVYRDKITACAECERAHLFDPGQIRSSGPEPV